MERDILFTDLKTPPQIFQLKDYLRELFRLIDRRNVDIDYASTIVIDADEGETFYVLLTGNITTITILNAFLGRKITLIFQQDESGSRTVAGFGAGVMLAGDAFAVTGSANRYTSITFEYCSTSKWVETGRTSDVY